MNSSCKECGTHMYFGLGGVCDTCQKQLIVKDALTTHYQNLGTFDLGWAILNCRRKGFSLRKTAKILDRDLGDVENAWDKLIQDAR